MRNSKLTYFLLPAWVLLSVRLSLTGKGKAGRERSLAGFSFGLLPSRANIRGMRVSVMICLAFVLAALGSVNSRANADDDPRLVPGGIMQPRPKLAAPEPAPPTIAELPQPPPTAASPPPRSGQKRRAAPAPAQPATPRPATRDGAVRF